MLRRHLRTNLPLRVRRHLIPVPMKLREGLYESQDGHQSMMNLLMTRRTVTVNVGDGENRDVYWARKAARVIAGTVDEIQGS
jgi:hypothetical protein